ncbi:hypothetical protein HanPSC8_Chr04g0184951 [Helianthus annuus]|nr:hypothetical protein HanPSC8_Chr04g0184951 [Helianthus annuus]
MAALLLEKELGYYHQEEEEEEELAGYRWVEMVAHLLLEYLEKEVQVGRHQVELAALLLE